MLAPKTLGGALRTSTRLRCRPPCVTMNVGMGTLSLSLARPLLAQRRAPAQFFSTHRPTYSLWSFLAPKPTAEARLAWLEADANAFPEDVERQLALFTALLQSGSKEKLEVMIVRWERMCQSHPESPLLHSAEAFKMYLSALVNSGRKSDVDNAVKRREELIAKHPAPSPSPASTPAATPTGPVAAAAETPATAPASEPAHPTPSTASAVTSSEALAQSVLSGQPAPSTPSASPSNTSGPLPGQTPPPPPGPQSPSEALAQSVLAQPLTQHTGFKQDGPIQVTMVEPKGAWFRSLVRYAIFATACTFLALVLISTILDKSGRLDQLARGKNSEFQPGDGKVYTFRDVQGVDEAKEELQDIVTFLKDPGAFATLGGKLPKGVLLAGPPGTGKTLLARAVAGEAGVPFFYASGSEFDELFVGVGAKRIRELFSSAKAKQPAILFIDELDSVGGRRNVGDMAHAKQTLNQLLTEMDGFKQSEGIVVLAATNLIEGLDPALIRPGRFDRIVAVPLPDVKGRAAILQTHLRDVVVGDDLDIKSVARGTPGFSGADLSNLVNAAAVHAAKEKAKAVTMKHLWWARDRVMMGAERKFFDEKGRMMTAYHEGGHTLTGLYTPGSMPLHKVTIVPRGQALGVTQYLPEDDKKTETYKQMLAHIDVSIGGRIAEELIYGTDNVTAGASSDIRNLSRVARGMVKEYGFSELGPVDYQEPPTPQRAELIEQEVSKIVLESESRVRQLLKEHENELHLLAKALAEHETLEADEVHKVIKGEPIRSLSEVLEEEIKKVEEDIGKNGKNGKEEKAIKE